MTLTSNRKLLIHDKDKNQVYINVGKGDYPDWIKDNEFIKKMVTNQIVTIENEVPKEIVKEHKNPFPKKEADEDVSNE